MEFGAPGKTSTGLPNHWVVSLCPDPQEKCLEPWGSEGNQSEGSRHTH